MKSRSRGGFTLVELVMAMAIISVLASMVTPRVIMVLERAYQGRSRGQLASNRSALAIYYSDTEGAQPFVGQLDGVASDRGLSLTGVLVPKYIPDIPAPYLADPFTFVFGLKYDEQAKINMAMSPPRDIVFVNGPPAAVLVNRPFVYDPSTGHLYICNGNYDVSGGFFYDW